MWQNSNSNCEREKTHSQNSISDKTKKKFGKNNLTPQQLMRCTLGSVLRSCDVFIVLWLPGVKANNWGV